MMDFSHGGVFMGLFSLIALVVLIYLIIQAAKHKPPATPSAETPLEILKKRYARGEVTKDQFDIMRKDLES